MLKKCRKLFLVFYLSEQILIIKEKKTVISAKDNGKPKKKIDLLKLTD